VLDVLPCRRVLAVGSAVHVPHYPRLLLALHPHVLVSGATQALLSKRHHPAGSEVLRCARGSAFADPAPAVPSSPAPPRTRPLRPTSRVSSGCTTTTRAPSSSFASPTSASSSASTLIVGGRAPSHPTFPSPTRSSTRNSHSHTRPSSPRSSTWLVTRLGPRSSRCSRSSRARSSRSSTSCSSGRPARL
jgi:hypothetical protein